MNNEQPATPIAPPPAEQPATSGETSIVECPDCKGSGKSGMVPLFAKTKDGKPLTEEQAKRLFELADKCQFCKGEGKVPAVQLEWKRIGLEWKKARILNGFGLREWAVHIGCKPSDYCWMENGTMEPDCRYAPSAQPATPPIAADEAVEREAEAGREVAGVAGTKYGPDEPGLWIRTERNHPEWAWVIRQPGVNGLLVADCYCLKPKCRPTLGALAVCCDKFPKGGWTRAVPASETNALREQLAEAKRDLAEFTAKEGPLNAEHCTLDELLEQLAKWKVIASGRTCVSFQNLSYGASSLWHQTHRENFRKVDRKPEALSRWVLEHCNWVKKDFPAQVLEILAKQTEQLAAVHTALNSVCRLNADVPLATLVQSAVGLIANLETEQGERLECEAGCTPYTGGELRHHRDCKHYPESMSKMLDAAQARIAEAAKLMKKLQDISDPNWFVFRPLIDKWLLSQPATEAGKGEEGG